MPHNTFPSEAFGGGERQKVHGGKQTLRRGIYSKLTSQDLSHITSDIGVIKEHQRHIKTSSASPKPSLPPLATTTRHSSDCRHDYRYEVMCRGDYCTSCHRTLLINCWSHPSSKRCLAHHLDASLWFFLCNYIFFGHHICIKQHG